MGPKDTPPVSRLYHAGATESIWSPGLWQGGQLGCGAALEPLSKAEARQP